MGRAARAALIAIAIPVVLGVAAAPAPADPTIIRAIHDLDNYGLIEVEWTMPANECSESVETMLLNSSGELYSDYYRSVACSDTSVRIYSFLSDYDYWVRVTTCAGPCSESTRRYSTGHTVRPSSGGGSGGGGGEQSIECQDAIAARDAIRQRFRTAKSRLRAAKSRLQQLLRQKRRLRRGDRRRTRIVLLIRAQRGRVDQLENRVLSLDVELAFADSKVGQTCS